MTDQSVRDRLTRGVAAARAGDKEEARFYLEWVLRTDANHDQQVEAHYWLAEIGDDVEEQRRHLTEALAINLGYGRARRKLAILEGRLKPEEMVDPDRLPSPTVGDGPAQADRFTCPQCGARMAYMPDGQSLFCEFCHFGETLPAGDEIDGHDFIAALGTARGHRRPELVRSFDCTSCGVAFSLSPETLSLSCPYCHSVYVLKSEERRELIPPHALIPFAITADEAGNRLRDWVQSERLRPNQMRAPVGLYLPLWLFTVAGTVDWQRTRLNEHRRLITERGRLPLLCDEIRVPAGHRLPEELVGELDDFDLGKLVSYDPRYLADWPAESYELPLADASLRARRIALDRLKERLASERRHGPGDLTISPANLVVESFKLVLLPVFLTHYHHEAKRYSVLVDGQSGVVCGQKPRRGVLGWLLGS
jgi:predicted RNA-binding Zn-ribbon protein involved in translation (DUF1610 family)